MSGLAAAGKGKVCGGGGGVGRDLGRTLTSVPSWFCRDAKEPDTMKEESGTDVSVRSRNRKANVAVVSTKETGGGGCPPPNLTWVPEWVLPRYLSIRDQEWGAFGRNGDHNLTSFLFLLCVCVFVFGLFGVFPWGMGVVLC